MCDPVTVTATANLVNSFGVATGINTVGASTAIAGFANTGISQAIGTGLSFINSPLSSLGMSFLTSRQQRKAAGLAAAQNEYQIAQYQRDAERKKLETDLRELNRKREYENNYKKNLSIMAFSNVDLSSESYKAFFRTQREQYLRDVDAIALRGLDDVTTARDLEQIAKMDRDANLKKGKVSGLTTLAKGMLTYSSIASETPDSQSLSKKLLG